MIDDVDYIVTVQCHIVKERCSGFLCEQAFRERAGGFAEYPKDKLIRFLSITCGGCCGKATLRKLTHLIRLATKAGGFAEYPKDRPIRFLSITCGGCCGKATLRKLTHLIRLATKAGIEKDRIVVQLSSCMTKDNFHSPRCPHTDYIKQLVARTGLRCREDTRISAKAEQRRRDGVYGGP